MPKITADPAAATSPASFATGGALRSVRSALHISRTRPDKKRDGARGKRDPSCLFPEFVPPSDWRDHCPPGAFADLPADAPPPERHLFLRALCENGLLRRYEKSSPETVAAAQKRLIHELGIVQQVGYEDYFLIVWDICREAAARQIPTLARGSAADSLACYCLGISTVCPLRFDLYFERFLNPDRMKFSKLADIDVDFPWDQRDEMMHYVFEKYGHDHVAMIGGFNRFHGRAALGDIGKVFGLGEREVRYFTKRMPSVRADQIADGLAGRPVAMADLPVAEAPYPEIMEVAQGLEDLPRHFMMHPCGIVVSKVPLRRLVPLMPSGRGPQMTQFDMDALEDMGFLKIDLLGQAGLSVLRDVLASVHQRHQKKIDLWEIPWDDAATWDMIAQGGARGVHHIESPAMTTLLVQSNCRDMDCLCAIVSVIRPGAADESKKLAFTRRHQGLEAPQYPHPSLAPHLADTYGLLVYEEHILMVAHHFAGMDLGRADVLRRELVKMKDADLLERLGGEFRTSAHGIGRTVEEAEEVWETLVRFHGYMFNKAHSASYAVEAYQGAWLKVRYPAEYMAAVLANERGFYCALFYTLEARRLGVPMLHPCINRSGQRYLVDEDVSPPSIRPPLSAINGLSASTRQRWEVERAQGVFVDVADFYHRVRPKPADFAALLDSGALDSFATQRTELFWQLHGAAELAVQESTDGQRDLFDSMAQVETSPRPRCLELPPSPSPPDLTEPDLPARAARECALFGYPISEDAFTYLAPGVNWESYCAIADLARYQGEVVHVCGLVVQTRHTHSANGQMMMFCTLADPSGFVECSLFPRVYRRFGHHLIRAQQEAERASLAVTALVDPFDNRRGQTLNIQRVQSPRKRAISV